MDKLCVGVLSDVLFSALPEFLAVADSMAVCIDEQNTLQCFDAAADWFWPLKLMAVRLSRSGRRPGIVPRYY